MATRLPALAIIFGLSLSAAGHAQSDTFSDFYACDAIDAPAERLACFDAVMKKQKLIRGMRDGSAESASRNRSDYKALRSGPVQSSPLSAVEGEARRPEPRRAESRPDTSRRARGRSFDLDAIETPYKTTVSGFNANDAGDFKLRIAEGAVFESAGGPKLRTDDLSGANVTLTKNFLGQWRLKIPGQKEPLWIRPVQN